MTPFEQKLASLTPAAVVRDAVLFASGRASAPSPRWWKRACGLLVVTQAVTLAVLVVERPDVPDSPPTPPAFVVPGLPPAPPPDPSSYLALLRTWDETRPPTAHVGGVQPRRSPPLTAGSRDFY